MIMIDVDRQMGETDKNANISFQVQEIEKEKSHEVCVYGTQYCY